MSATPTILNVHCNVVSEGGGRVWFAGGDRLEPNVVYEKLQEGCWLELTRVFISGPPEWVIAVYDDDGLRAAVSVERPGTYIISRDGVKAGEGEDAPFTGAVSP